MKILLVSIQEFEDIREETGIEMIATFMRKDRHEVRIIVIKNASECLEIVRKFEPEVVGLSAYLNNKKVLVEICKLIKDYNENIFIGVGGYLPTYYPKELLVECSEIDAIIMYEGELVWCELLSALKTKSDIGNIKGLAFRCREEIVINDKHMGIKNMNSMPYQDRDMLADYNLKYVYLSTSRGCEKYCTFCCSNEFWRSDGKSWKGKDISYIVDEIEYIINKYRVYSFYIQDNSFEDGMNANKLVLFAEELIRRKLDISYHLNIRAEFCRRLDNAEIDLLKKSGLVGFFIGIESNNAEDLKIYGKKANVEDNHYALEVCKKNGIIVDIGFINFNPYSSVEKLRTNIDFLEKYDKAVEMYLLSSSLMIFKGTAIYRMIKRDGLLRDGDYADYFRYLFVDEEIERLKIYIKKIYEEVLNEFGYGKVLIYSLRYRYILSNLKRKIEDKEVLQFIGGTEKVNSLIIKEINKRNAQWFRELLNIVTVWSEELADAITEQYLEKNKLQGEIKLLEMNNRKLLHYLMKKDKKYVEVYKKYI